MAQSIPYGGYPAPGALAVKNIWAGDHFGPGASQGNYQANGYAITPAALGMARIEWAQFSDLAQSENYYARVRYPAISGNGETGAPGFNSVTVQWYYAANSVEVANNTNLNGECAQLIAFGM